MPSYQKEIRIRILHRPILSAQLPSSHHHVDMQLSNGNNFDRNGIMHLEHRRPLLFSYTRIFAALNNAECGQIRGLLTGR